MSHFAPLVVSLMDVVKKLAALRGVLMTAGLVSLLNMNGTAFGQSNVVFMAADVSPGTTSKLSASIPEPRHSRSLPAGRTFLTLSLC